MGEARNVLFPVWGRGETNERTGGVERGIERGSEGGREKESRSKSQIPVCKKCIAWIIRQKLTVWTRRAIKNRIRWTEVKNSQEEHFLSFFFFKPTRFFSCAARLWFSEAHWAFCTSGSPGSHRSCEPLQLARREPPRQSGALVMVDVGFFFFQHSNWHENLLDTPYPPLSPAPPLYFL